MRIISGNKGSGKTTELIYKSADLGIPIIAPTSIMAQIILKTAKQMGVDIPEPVSINFVVDKGRGARKYLVDELDLCLKQLGISAEYVTLCHEEVK